MKHVALSFACCVTLAAVAVVSLGEAQESEYKSIPDAAKEVAPRIARELRGMELKDGDPLTVGVFAFGDEQGRVTEANAFAAKTLPGELTTHLRNLSDRKYIVLDPFELQEIVASANASPAKLKTAQFKDASAELKKLGLDAAVVGSIQRGAGHGFNVHADVLFGDGAPLQVSTDVDVIEPFEFVPQELSTRLSVGIYVGEEEISMYRDNRMGGDYVLDLDRDRHYGKPFAIRIINNSYPPVGWLAPSKAIEATRFFTAAVFVDGINSIYEKTPDGSFHPSQEHPDNVTKWVVGRQGFRINPGYHSDTNSNAQTRVNGYGSALLDIGGFQVNGDAARQFVFADAGESVAHDIGLTKEIGIISMYFYAEMLDGDEVYFGPGAAGAMPGGVQLGMLVPNPVMRVTVKTHPEPVEAWKIYYRYRGDKDDLRSRPNAVAIATAKREMQARLQESPPFDRRGRRPRFDAPFGGGFGSAPRR